MLEIICDEMLELVSLGVKVLYFRVVEIVWNYGMLLVVLLSWSDVLGICVVLVIFKCFVL